MGFVVKFYTFEKSVNSTKQPTSGELKYAFSKCALKNGTNIGAPGIQLSANSFENGQNPHTLNYCYIEEFSRFYYVISWTYDRGIWTAACVVDVLATFKSDIGSSTRFIVKSENFFDDKLSSPDFAVTDISIQRSETTVKFTNSLAAGSYILGVNNGVKGSLNINYYILSQTGFSNFLAQLWSRDFHNILLQWANPMQYIVSCFWLPITPLDLVGHQPLVEEVANIPLLSAWEESDGAQIFDTSIDLGSRNYRLYSSAKPVITVSAAIDIPYHPKYKEYGRFVNRSPYSRYVLHFGPFGNIELDSEVFYDNHSVFYKLMMDITTGDAVLQLATNAFLEPIISEHVCNLATPIPVSQTNTNYGGIVGGITSAIAGLATKNVGSIISGVGDAVKSSMPSIETKGGVSSLLRFYTPCFVQAHFAILTEKNNNVWARPCMKNAKINTLSGFIVCGDGDTKINGLRGEYDEVNRIMKEGFYYE